MERNFDRDLFSPKNAEEICSLLSRFGDRARLLAGGTDLMVKINRRQYFPEIIIFIADCGLSYIRETENTLTIGAATPFQVILDSPRVKLKTPLLVEVVKHIASPAVRNLGTLGGNLANASPAADSATALLVLDAKVKILSSEGERTVAVQDLFLGPGRTVLKANEFIKEILIPLPDEDSTWAYRKLGRRQAHTLSILAAAVGLKWEARKCGDVRIALGAAAPTPLRAMQAEDLIRGKDPREELFQEAAQAAAEAIKPIDDIRASAWYRKRACEVLVKRLLDESLLNRRRGDGRD